MDLFRIHTFESKKKTNRLKRMASSIHKVTQKDVVKVLNIFLFAVLVWSPVKVKKTHQICELTMYISKYFKRRFGLKDHGLTYYNFLSYITKLNDLLWLKSHFDRIMINKNLRLHKHIQEISSNVKLVSHTYLFDRHSRRGLTFALLVSNHRLQ